jgi:hypothetical protein
MMKTVSAQSDGFRLLSVSICVHLWLKIMDFFNFPSLSSAVNPTMNYPV